jgi:transposase
VTALRDLAMTFTSPSLRVVEDEGAFYLGSSDFGADATTDFVRIRGAGLLAIACGSCALEFGRFSPPRIEAVTRVYEDGRKEDLRCVGNSVRMAFEVNALQEREREDGMIEVVEVAPPPSNYPQWHEVARHDSDVADVLAILGRDNVRWHDLWHVYEIIKATVGRRMFDDSWVTMSDEERFTRTVNSRGAIGREARHGHERFVPPKRSMEFAEARRFVHTLVRRLLDLKVPPAPTVVIRVVDVRSPTRVAATEPATSLAISSRDRYRPS